MSSLVAGKRSVLLCVSFLMASVALACTVLPMIPFSVRVTSDEVHEARREGASNPFNGAFLKKLDSMGAQLMGADAWRATAFVGSVTYRYKIGPVTGASAITLSKPCGKTAEESSGTEDALGQRPGNGGGGGGGGGDSGVGGWFPGGGGCYGHCQPPYGTVGPIEQA